MKTTKKTGRLYILHVAWICASLLCPFHSYAQMRDPVASYSKDCNSFIHLSGKSNINSFSFTYSTSSRSDAWQIQGIKDTGFLCVSVPVRDFEASNPLMYEDFLRLIKAREFPVLKILIPKEELEMKPKDDRKSSHNIEIMLAGVTRLYSIVCYHYKCGNNLFLQGVKTIKFSDFHIQPPEKLKGLIKVNDEIAVNFGLIITFTDANQSIASR